MSEDIFNFNNNVKNTLTIIIATDDFSKFYFIE